MKRKIVKRRVPLEVFKERSKLKEIKRKVDKEMREREERLRKQLVLARRSAKMKQSAVAYHFGRDQTFIAKLETGVRRLTFVEVEKLAALYGKQLADFWEDIPAVRHYSPSV